VAAKPTYWASNWRTTTLDTVTNDHLPALDSLLDNLMPCPQIRQHQADIMATSVEDHLTFAGCRTKLPFAFSSLPRQGLITTISIEQTYKNKRTLTNKYDPALVGLGPAGLYKSNTECQNCTQLDHSHLQKKHICKYHSNTHTSSS
jgi:hypothetical protein